MKTPSDPLIKAIDDARVLARVSCGELCEKAGLAANTWSYWRNGHVPMAVHSLRHFCEALDLEIVVRPRST